MGLFLALAIWGYNASCMNLGLTQHIASNLENSVQLYNCCICYSHPQLSEVYVFSCCGSPICFPCLNCFLDTAVTDISELTCPNDKCENKNIQIADLDDMQRKAGSHIGRDVISKLKDVVCREICSEMELEYAPSIAEVREAERHQAEQNRSWCRSMITRVISSSVYLGSFGSNVDPLQEPLIPQEDNTESTPECSCCIS